MSSVLGQARRACSLLHSRASRWVEPAEDEVRVSRGALSKALGEALAQLLTPVIAETCDAALQSADNERQFSIIQTYSVVLHVGNGTIKVELWQKGGG